MPVNRSSPGAIIANLCYEDLEKAIGWLCETFGFVERFRYGSPEQVLGAQLQLADAIVMLFAPSTGHGAADTFKFRAPRSGEASHTTSRAAARGRCTHAGLSRWIDLVLR